MSGPAAVTAAHLRRDAYVYVRQSTVIQVREHREGLQRQYELAERAVGLGWSAAQVVVIDEDLGRSGSEASARSGFQRLVAEVGLGQVGLILGIEVSRLARNNADWYQLLDLCALTDTLIADGDGLYHPGAFNDRLVLGLKGTMSEAELHLIRGRLTAGLRHKAARGELRQGLPVGYDYDPDDAVVLSVDEAVVEAIATVFRRFDELGSARQVLLSLLADGLRLPRRSSLRARVRWTAPTYPAVHDLLTNPCYAGAFVFGRTTTDKRLDADGRLAVRTRQVARDRWEVCIPDHHPGFIDWARYETNQQTLRDNWRPPRGAGGGAAREGSALLQGRLRCGRCSRMMRTGYSGAKGNCPRYVCAQARTLYGAGAACQSLGGRRLEQRVLDEVFAVLEPAALAATAKALAEAQAHHTRRLAAFELAVERSRFEAERARRQFDAVEPENRLVARTVERAWEQRLSEQRRAEADLAAQRARRPASLSAEELAWLRRAGADVRRVFDAPTTTIRERKQLLRAVITEVTVTVDDGTRTAAVTIVWQGGATTALTLALNPTGGHFRVTAEDTVELVRRLAVHYDDATIAAILARQHRVTGTGLPFTKDRVKSLRVARGIPAGTRTPVTPAGDDAVVVSVQKAEQLLGVSKATIYRWLRDGFIVGRQLTPGAPWHIRIDDTVRARIVGEAPDGWLSLEQAAAALGVSRRVAPGPTRRPERRARQPRQTQRPAYPGATRPGWTVRPTPMTGVRSVNHDRRRRRGRRDGRRRSRHRRPASPGWRARRPGRRRGRRRPGSCGGGSGPHAGDARAGGCRERRTRRPGPRPGSRGG
jgi:DNA invertase Pin-like site-specific DNA recombinase